MLCTEISYCLPNYCMATVKLLAFCTFLFQQDIFKILKLHILTQVNSTRAFCCLENLAIGLDNRLSDQFPMIVQLRKWIHRLQTTYKHVIISLTLTNELFVFKYVFTVKLLNDNDFFFFFSQNKPKINESFFLP